MSDVDACWTTSPFRRVSIRSPSQPFTADDRAQIACDLGAALHDGRIHVWHLHALAPLPVGHDVAGAHDSPRRHTRCASSAIAKIDEGVVDVLNFA
ncbi:hypothetical protein [Burkholderia ubonensis]|uniref:hypothetical protein n=1 Tax=Burkholderia ubonensis TaxID=101571 RepID=UPI0012FBFF07|nr:hypothetical protein [Burkholderia ubonensis]